VSKYRGLPQDKRMRHDSHFVEEITSPRSESIGRLVEIDRIEPNPHQPRKQFGDLTELVASIKEKGILEPILVRSWQGKYQIIAGERRYQAARLAGLRRLPCVEVDVDARGMLEISLIENLQRKDLTPFEEAAAIQKLVDQFRYTHEEIARRLAKSRTVITEALSLNRIPEEVQEQCRRADIASRSMLVQIARQETEDEMKRLVHRITEEGIGREEARRFNRDEDAPRRSKHFTFRFRPEDESFQFTLTFQKSRVERDELIRTLRQILERLIAEGPSAGRGARR
jgi:ParB family transcriptional regulator, chromosome partitioning protein